MESGAAFRICASNPSNAIIAFFCVWIPVVVFKYSHISTERTWKNIVFHFSPIFHVDRSSQAAILSTNRRRSGRFGASVLSAIYRASCSHQYARPMNTGAGEIRPSRTHVQSVFLCGAGQKLRAAQSRRRIFTEELSGSIEESQARFCTHCFPMIPANIRRKF